MKSLFNYDNPVFRFLGRIFDMVILNLLCLICCVPIITIGASVTALYYCMLKIVREQDTSVSKMFFHSFLQNMKQGFLMTLLFGGITLVLLLDILACRVIDLAFLKYVKYLVYVFCIVLIVIASYAFPLLAQFENTIRGIVKNAFFMSMTNFLYTIVIAGLNMLPIVLFFRFPELFVISFPIWLTFGFSTITWVNAKMFTKIFDEYV